AAVQKICLDPRRHDLLNLNCGSIEHVTEAHRVRVNASFRGAVESSKRHWHETKYRRHVQDGRRFLSFEMLDKCTRHSHSAEEIGLELRCKNTVVDRLRDIVEQHDARVI